MHTFNQPRKTFDEQTIQELAESIREQGILSPILVRPQGEKFQIRALRQLLAQAEVLRAVHSFLKEKKLTGDESLELVKFIKSKPGFTVEDSYKEVLGLKRKETDSSKSPVDIINIASERLAKALGKLGESDISPEDKAGLKTKLKETMDIIECFINEL